MSNKLPVVSGKELIKLLEQLGFTVTRIKVRITVYITLMVEPPLYPFIKTKTYQGA
jgi:hypothetical protein